MNVSGGDIQGEKAMRAMPEWRQARSAGWGVPLALSPCPRYKIQRKVLPSPALRAIARRHSLTGVLRCKAPPELCKSTQNSLTRERESRLQAPVRTHQIYPRPENLHYIPRHLTVRKAGSRRTVRRGEIGRMGSRPFPGRYRTAWRPRRAPRPKSARVRGNSVRVIEGSPMRRVLVRQSGQKPRSAGEARASNIPAD
jgi:hypothetical protein